MKSISFGYVDNCASEMFYNHEFKALDQNRDIDSIVDKLLFNFLRSPLRELSQHTHIINKLTCNH